MIDFAMTYPCYVPLQTPVEPWTFTAEGHQCVALATDGDLLNRFFASNAKPGATYVRRTMRDAIELAGWLLDDVKNGRSKGRPITHVLVDPGDPSRRSLCYPIPEFAAHVLTEDA